MVCRWPKHRYAAHDCIIKQMHSMILHFWHTSAPTCINTKMPCSGSHKKTVKANKPICSTPPYKNDSNLNMLKYIKLINYSITMLYTKICKNKLPQLPVHSRFHICGWRIQTSVSIPYDLRRSPPDILCYVYNIEQCSVPGKCTLKWFVWTVIRHCFLEQIKNTVHLNRQFLLLFSPLIPSFFSSVTVH